MIVTKIQIKMSCKSLNERTLSKIKRELKAAIFFLQGRSYNLAESCAVFGPLGSARLSSARNLHRPSRWQWNEEERGGGGGSAVTGRRPRFPRKRSCRGNHCRWCRSPSWRRWSLGGTRSSAWSGRNNHDIITMYRRWFMRTCWSHHLAAYVALLLYTSYQNQDICRHHTLICNAF